MRTSAYWLLASLTLCLAACGDNAGLERLSRGETGKVVEVRSGDVLALDNGLVVRLAGLQAPRMDEPGAQAARADLERRALGKRVALYYGGARRDAFGRVALTPAGRGGADRRRGPHFVMVRTSRTIINRAMTEGERSTEPARSENALTRALKARAMT